MRRGALLPLFLFLFVGACDGGGDVDGGSLDLGRPDATADVGIDAPADLGMDAPCTTDADGDGHRSRACGGDDCDDADPFAYPGLPEVCDDHGHDEDCDPTTLGGDADHDSFAFFACCNTQSDGSLRCGDDCDDHAATINPTAIESCNGRDDDCDGDTDEGVSGYHCYDADGDGHGAINTAVRGCTTPLGATTICNDCDDRDPTRYPGSPETCDGVDHDCDGVADSHCACTPVGDTRTCGTTAGACIAGVQSCAGGGWDATCTGGVFPMVETCNAVDDDCDGVVDEGVTFDFYVDCDGDGYGDDATRSARCLAPVGVPPGCPHGFFAMTGGDCDDADVTRNPTLGCGITVDAGVGVDAGATCTLPLAECDGMSSTVCETDTSTDVTSCGACGLTCRRTLHGCIGGVCQSDALQLAAGPANGCVVRGEGTLDCWGDDAYGQLLAPLMDRTSPSPVPVSHVVSVSMGSKHGCARLDDASVICFGAPDFGELGDGAGGTARTSMMRLFDTTSVSAGFEHTCYSTSDGRAWCVGWNMLGQLGDGTTVDRTAPQVVPGVGGVVQVAAGWTHTCARIGDGTAWCWGKNGYGELGDGTLTGRLSPVPVMGLTNIIDLVAGNETTCARTADGLAWCWGSNNDGQLGDGSTTRRSTPVLVLGLVDVTSLSTGNGTTCAATMDGLVWCWGANDHGQLGDGTTMPQLLPQRVPGLVNVVQVAVGQWFTCARLADHSVWCWGDNLDGELGDGTTLPHSLAAPIVDP